MHSISSLIRQDREFGESIRTLKEQLSAKKPLPLVINGLSGGAADAYLAEAVAEARRASDAPCLLLVGSDTERARTARILSDCGLRTLEFKPRDLVFHNISASCDIDRERLSVLSALMHGECDAVVTTPSAALAYTMPQGVLAERELRMSVGDEIPPSQLSASLVSMGFARVDMVESAGQFSMRGDILDVWHTSAAMPTRVEFFGDEIDRISLFDP